jgi:aryl-alcohol dehydrogenase-like predicted oxidoreductase
VSSTLPAERGHVELSQVELGLGLLSIGRAWGHIDPGVPDQAAVTALLDGALALGIRVFDTAPAYGTSEARFGAFLAGLDPAGRAGLTIATKCGEHWDEAKQAPFVDHGYDALCRSIDRSLARLGRIDLIQLHKTTQAVLDSPAVDRALAHARARGVERLGASVSDLATALRVSADGRFGAIQLPYNSAEAAMAPALDRAGARGLFVLINRPFAMGRLLHEAAGPTSPAATAAASFRAILAHRFTGAVLSGTRSARHLADNLAAFRASLRGAP